MTYHLFISHSWNYSNTYNDLIRLLDSKAYFSYKNYSVPKDDPIHNAPYDYQLKAAIRNQMQHASCVLILAGVYSTYSKWINIEIQLAQEMGKKIIAIEPMSFCSFFMRPSLVLTLSFSALALPSTEERAASRSSRVATPFACK